MHIPRHGRKRQHTFACHLDRYVMLPKKKLQQQQKRQDRLKGSSRSHTFWTLRDAARFVRHFSLQAAALEGCCSVSCLVLAAAYPFFFVESCLFALFFRIEHCHTEFRSNSLMFSLSVSTSACVGCETVFFCLFFVIVFLISFFLSRSLPRLYANLLLLASLSALFALAQFYS